MGEWKLPSLSGEMVQILFLAPRMNLAAPHEFRAELDHLSEQRTSGLNVSAAFRRAIEVEDAATIQSRSE
jgi:hypothetical protein